VLPAPWTVPRAVFVPDLSDTGKQLRLLATATACQYEFAC